MAFETFRRGWTWFVEGLAEAWLWSEARLRPRPVVSVDLRSGGTIRGPGGELLGRIVADAGGTRLEPATLANRLAGARLDLIAPAPWLYRRDLEPVATASAPFLDAFVRHQIERITPWRAADVFYVIRHRPLPSDASRLAVDVGVVPRRLVAPSLAALAPLQAAAVRITTGEAGSPEILLGGGAAARGRRLRRVIGAAVAFGAGAVVLTSAWAFWAAAEVREEIDAQDGVIEQRKAVLAVAARRDRAGTEAEAALRALRAGRPRTVELIEALSTALPDTAYLTELAITGDDLRVSGISGAVPDLVPALERSGAFRAVAFSAATTRVEEGSGDRFHLEMKAVTPPPAKEAAALVGPEAVP